MSRKRQRRLSEDDLEVWRQVARTAKPLGPAKKPPLAVDGHPPAESALPGERPTSVPDFRLGERSVYDHSKGHNLIPTLEARLASQPVRMDRKTFMKMRRGKLRPERKIDLHGMNLAQASPALSRFIVTAHAAGCRLVLVVTGKGRSNRDADPIPTPRGVLRHQVPHWLNLPPLNRLVLQITEAHASHGGAGAYYVYLSRPRQST